MSKTSFLKTAYDHPDNKNINALINYLKGISGKELSNKCISQNVLKTKWHSKEDNLRNRCHIQACISYFKELISLGDKSKVSQFQNAIADLAYFIRDVDEKENTSFLFISTNELHSTIHFDIIKNLFYDHQISFQHRNNYSSDLLTVYGIRLSLEKRVRGILGIDYATYKNKIIGLSNFLNICTTLKTVEYSEKISWQEIEWVNKWSNSFMHRHIRPHPWTIYWSLLVLEPLINPKDPIILSNGSKQYGFNVSAIVKDRISFEKELDQILNNQFPGLEIKWLPKREVFYYK